MCNRVLFNNLLYLAYALASALEKLQNPQVTNQQDGDREHHKKRQPEEIA
jgi:hypothetical protein